VPVGPLLALLIAAVVVNLALMAVVLAPTFRGRPSPFLAADADHEPPASVATLTGQRIIDGAFGDGETAVDGVPTAAYDRVVRIVSFVFLLSASAIVAVTGLWPATQPAVLVLLAVAGLFVLTIHDILPASLLGTARFVAEGSVAITFATLLVALTGQENSPFFFTFPLIVAGAALVVNPRVTVALATASSIGYLAAVGIRPDGRAFEPGAIAAVGINVAALVLLSYVAMVIAREQRRSREAAIRLSTVDHLTGLFNRAFFFAALDREIQRSKRTNRGFCLLMMDLDGLKAINDRFGHFHGDEALRSAGETIRAGVRRIDTAARYGGDEFVVLLPETDPTGAFVLAEKIRQGVAERAIGTPEMDLRASLSIGVVSYPDDGATVDDLMITADQAMYVSKRQGKNRVAAYQGLRADEPASPVRRRTRSGAATPAGERDGGSETRPLEPAARRSGEPVGVMAVREDETESV
jgi:diguanylate cyclase (GGDEF)-like protein